jgi:hypothetical protein
MKQLLFLLLFPCLALAQYQGNGNQKITLGEQTTADGLVYRGIRADTTSKIVPFSDTSAYIILDTVEKTLWLYKAGQIPKWQQVGGSTLDTATMLLPYWRSGRFSGVLPVANGGTGATSLSPNNYLIRTNSSGIFDTAAIYEEGGKIGIGTSQPFSQLSFNGNYTESGLQIFEMTKNGISRDDARFSISNSTDQNALLSTFKSISNFKAGSLTIGGIFIACPQEDDSTDDVGWRIDGQNKNQSVIANGSIVDFTTAGNVKMRIMGNGKVLIGYTADNGAYPLQVNGQIFATNATIATSDEKFKENITPLNKGLEIVNKLKPVTFNFISDTENNFSEYEEVGFIAQDVDRVLSTETFSKSIVKAADDSEPTSTMGLATQNLIPILTKAIQEQQALIKALEQRILILENK